VGGGVRRRRHARERWQYPNTSKLGNEVSLEDFRKPMEIELYNQAGAIVLRWHLHNCWLSEYTTLPDLDSEANAVALQSLTIEHEGWERDTSVTPPTG
jgi:phage tail-like protein